MDKLNDISTPNDVKLLVDTFYSKVLLNEQIGFIFTDIVKISLEKHMPLMYSFWESILFYGSKYKGNPMLKHIAINKKHALTKQHFDAWLQLWEATVDELFCGEKADEAIAKSKQIGLLMQHKIAVSK